jgi:hypothetical protein
MTTQNYISGYPSYCAVVYHDGTYVYAVDINGNQLYAPVVSSAYTDQYAIQAAINYAYNLNETDPQVGGGTVLIKSPPYNSYYHIGAGTQGTSGDFSLFLKNGTSIKCEDTWHTYFQITDVNFCQIGAYCTWDGGFISNYNATCYSKTVFLFDAGKRIPNTGTYTVDSSADTTHFVDATLHGETINTDAKVTVTGKGSAYVSSFNDTTHTVTLATAIAGLTAGDTFYISTGSTQQSDGYGVGAIRNVSVRQVGATQVGGKVFHFKCERNTADSGMFGETVENIHIQGWFQYGIYVSTPVGATQYYNNFIWNTFRNIWMMYLGTFIYLNKQDTYGSINSNIFENIWMNSYPSTRTTAGIVSNAGSNRFLNVHASDWYSTNGYILNLTSASSGTYFQGSMNDPTTQLLDNGTGNIIKLMSDSTPRDAELLSDISSILDIMGTPKLLCPLIENTGTTVNDYTRNGYDLTASVDTANLYYPQFGSSERIFHTFDLNGTDEYMSIADASGNFSFGNGVSDSAFSVFALVYPDSVANNVIAAKWDATTGSEKREWVFRFASGQLQFYLYDESANTYIGRDNTVTNIPVGHWYLLVATYSGNSTCAGCKVYSNGVQVDNADHSSGVYVAMEPLAQPFYVGTRKGTAALEYHWNGRMAYAGVCAKELSADEIWTLYQRLKGIGGL